MPIAMTVTDIFVRVARTFGDESAVQVEFADIIRWINDAQREAVMQHEGLLLGEVYIDLEAQAEYAIPAEVFTIQSLSVRNTVTESYYPLRALSTATLNEYFPGWDGPDFGSGRPQIYTTDQSNSLILFPTPNVGALVGDGIKIICSKYPNDVIDDTSPIDLPPYYHSYVEHFCMMKAYEKDEDWESADRKAQLIQSTLDFNNNRGSWFGRETYPSVSPMVEDYD